MSVDGVNTTVVENCLPVQLVMNGLNIMNYMARAHIAKLLLFQTERSFASKSRTGNQQCILIHY
jgi:hypothetical protein